MAIADNFRAIKAALNRLTGAVPSGEVFSGLKDAKRVTKPLSACNGDLRTHVHSWPLWCGTNNGDVNPFLHLPQDRCLACGVVFGDTSTKRKPTSASDLQQAKDFTLDARNKSAALAKSFRDNEEYLERCAAEILDTEYKKVVRAKNANPFVEVPDYYPAFPPLGALPGDILKRPEVVVANVMPKSSLTPLSIVDQTFRTLSDSQNMELRTMRDAVQMMPINWAAEAQAHREALAAGTPREKCGDTGDGVALYSMSLPDEALRAFDLSADFSTDPLKVRGRAYVPKDYDMYGSYSNAPGPETDLTEKALDNALMQLRAIQAQPLRNCTCDECRLARIDHDLSSTLFGPEGTNNCCGNPVCAICADGRRRGVTVLEHGNPDYEAVDLGNEGLVIFERKFWPEGGTTFYRGDALFSIKRDEDIGITIQALR